MEAYFLLHLFQAMFVTNYIISVFSDRVFPCPTFCMELFFSSLFCKNLLKNYRVFLI